MSHRKGLPDGLSHANTTTWAQGSDVRQTEVRSFRLALLVMLAVLLTEGVFPVDLRRLPLVVVAVASRVLPSNCTSSDWVCEEPMFGTKSWSKCKICPGGSAVGGEFKFTKR
jgi:hypothetical protein